MAWDPYKPTSENETVKAANESAQRISKEILGVFVSSSLNSVGKLMRYEHLVKLLEAAASGAATRGYVQGYNQAVDDMRAGKTLQRLTSSPDVSDQR